MVFNYNSVDINIDNEVYKYLENVKNKSLIDIILYLTDNFKIKNTKKIIRKVFDNVTKDFDPENEVIFISDVNKFPCKSYKSLKIYKLGIKEFLNLDINDDRLHVMTSPNNKELLISKYQLFDLDEVDGFCYIDGNYKKSSWDNWFQKDPDCILPDKPYRARLVYDSCFDHNYCLSIYYDLVHDYFNVEYDVESKSWKKIVNKN